jgi:gliding motility-associated-like protein
MFKLRTSLFFIFLFSGYLVFPQAGFVNNGTTINVEQGAYIQANDFTNNQASSTDGSVNLDGTFTVTGNITNNSSGPVFINIEPIPDGNIILDGTNQSIQGTGSAIEFENLDVENSTKTLSLNNCDVKGILDINGTLALNKNRLILSYSDPSAITYQSGSIISESIPSDGLGEIEWKIGGTIGTYNIPFGTDSVTNNLNVVLSTLTSASPNDGSVLFATYPTDALNEPLPATVFSLDTLKPENLSDRYWEIGPVFNSKPDISLVLKYTDPDIDLTDNPGMIETNLKLARYNDLQNTWTDMKMTGTCDIANNTVTTGTITQDNFYSNWVIEEFELRIPNAFTPDNSGKNDFFMLGYHVKIFNRWDQLIFEGDDGWDGKYDGKLVNPGTYYYELVIPDIDNTTKTVTGVITLVSNK